VKWDGIPFTPTIVTPEYLVWDVPTAGKWLWAAYVGIALQIDQETEPASLLTHTVEISPQPVEDRYDDNAVTWVDRVNETGSQPERG
jgi:hypothetical protein